jgi:HK97 gp10 family phage protein
MLVSRIPQITRELRSDLDSGLKRGADLVAVAAEGRVSVRTGKLRASIHVAKTGISEYEVIAGNDEVFYGNMVEHGTTHSAPQPFLVPSLEGSRSAVLALAREALRDL